MFHWKTHCIQLLPECILAGHDTRSANNDLFESVVLQIWNHFYINGCFGEESPQPESSLQIFSVRAACTSDGMEKRSEHMKINCREPWVCVCVCTHLPECLHVDIRLVCVWLRVEGKAHWLSLLHSRGRVQVKGGSVLDVIQLFRSANATIKLCASWEMNKIVNNLICACIGVCV